MPLSDSWIYLHIYLKIRSKIEIHITVNSDVYTIIIKRVFLFPCLKILLRHSNRWTICTRHEPNCGVYALAQRADTVGQIWR
jgi:hypothetical protein